MDFSAALKGLRQGYKARRAGWNGKGMFIFLVPGSQITVAEGKPLAAAFPAGETVNYLPHIDMRTAQGDVVPWLASQTDILGVDWIVEK